MNNLRINFAVILMLVSPQAFATGDCAVGYTFLQNGQYDKAYGEFRILAERGYSYYMNEIANMHRNGQGVPASNMMAHVWYSLSAAQGDEKGIDGKDQMSAKLSDEQLGDSMYLSTEYAKDYLEPYIVSWSLQ